MSVLVTGGAGYIGSHTVLVLLEAGYKVVVLDNLQNSSFESLRRVKKITHSNLTFVEGDIRDREHLQRLLVENKVNAVLHFAGLKSVKESVSKPLEYYSTNFTGTLALCQAMQGAGVYRLVFSSSATVYGENNPMPLGEDLPAGQPTNPYGRSKLMVEGMLQDLAAADPRRWSVALLRYFNPVGAHRSGLIGEDPHGKPSNLLPYIAQVAVGRCKQLAIYGNDYPTVDGTGVRDYIHVMDLAEGHLCALQALDNLQGMRIWNLGTGKGYSVLEVVAAFEKASGRHVPYCFEPRRAGDVAESWANPNRAEEELRWKARRDLEEMMRDTWRWQQNNPNGYSYF